MPSDMKISEYRLQFLLDNGYAPFVTVSNYSYAPDNTSWSAKLAELPAGGTSPRRAALALAERLEEIASRIRAGASELPDEHPPAKE